MPPVTPETPEISDRTSTTALVGFWPYASVRYACLELVIAGSIISLGFKLHNALFTFGATPWLVAFAALFLWWRRPNVLAIGLGRPASLTRTLTIGGLVGVGYQFLGIFVIEPTLARLTGQLPDLTLFRPLIGNWREVAYWIVISWTLAALLEEIAYRGWILNRFAELGRYSRSAWVGAMLAASLLFGIVHAYQGLSGMIATGLTGLVFAGLYLATGRNLWASIVAHGILDTTGFVLIYLGLYPGM